MLIYWGSCRLQTCRKIKGKLRDPAKVWGSSTIWFSKAKIQSPRNKKETLVVREKVKIIEAIKIKAKQNSIYLKKIPSKKKIKENYINNLKLINSDLKLSLQKTKEGKPESGKESGAQAFMAEAPKSEILLNIQPKRIQSEMVNKVLLEKEFPESPLLLKQEAKKALGKSGPNVPKHSEEALKFQFKAQETQKIKKSELIKKKSMNMPLLKSKVKKNAKDPKKKDKNGVKAKGSERRSQRGNTRGLNLRTNLKLDPVPQSTLSKANDEIRDSVKMVSKKQGTSRTYGRPGQKKTQANNEHAPKKSTKPSGQTNAKSHAKPSTAEKTSIRKKPSDEEKPPNKPNGKLEKGHYLKDQAPGIKKKPSETEKTKTRPKSKKTPTTGALKKKPEPEKPSQSSENLCSLNNSLKNKKEESKHDNLSSFEPQKALKKKVAKKKNFSLNFDSFNKKVKKDYHTHVNKFVSKMESGKKPASKMFRTEKSGNKGSSENPKLKMDSDSEGGDFDYGRGDSMKNNSHLEEKLSRQRSQHSKSRRSNTKLSKSRNGLRVSGNLKSKLKSPKSRGPTDSERRKRSKGKALPKNQMSQNYRNHFGQNDHSRKMNSSAKNHSGVRNPSIKDFSRRKKQNLSISMNKRSGFRKSNEFLLNRKKNQSINPGNRFKNLEKLHQKRAVSDTKSVSNISFTNIEKAGLRKVKNIVEYIKQREHILPPFTKARSVVKNFGIIKGFIVNTHKGCVRAGNEDRVSILLNAQHKFRKSKKKMNNCAMFSVFDGHGGTDCCNFLKENLHNKILADLDIHEDFDASLKKLFTEVDQTYLKRAIKKKQNYSGSCANCLFVLDEEVVVVNTGDSRAVCSKNGGSQVEAMSIDHKPGYFSEFSRVIGNGGQLYRVSSNLKTIENMFYTVTNYSDVLQIDEIEASNKNLCFGPWRIKPGGLSVSR